MNTGASARTPATEAVGVLPGDGPTGIRRSLQGNFGCSQQWTHYILPVLVVGFQNGVLVADLRVCQPGRLLVWQDRGRATVRLLYLMFVRLMGGWHCWRARQRRRTPSCWCFA